VSDPTEVLVLGAGIIGATVAEELARRGASVRLLDSRQPGQGATQASAGMLAPHTEIRTPASFAAWCVEALDVYDAFVARLRRDTPCEFEYTRCGTVEVALDDEGAARLRQEAVHLERDVHLGARWLESADAWLEEPTLTHAARGALLIGTHGFVAVSALLAAVVASARKYGAVVEAGVPATRIVRTAAGLVVRTPAGDRSAERLVVCAGSWSGHLLAGEAVLPVRPVRGQLLHLRPNQPVSSRILWGPRCYLVPWSDGTLLAGATVEEVGFDERTTLEGIGTLTAAAIELVPALASAELVAARVGLRPAAPDGLPIVGAWPGDRRLILATAHYRNGVLLAPLTAAVVADLLLDGRAHPVLADLGPDRFTGSLTAPGGDAWHA
jgi:glycine oxidase ThiO